MNDTDTVAAQPSSGRKVADMAPLIARIREFLAEREQSTYSQIAPWDTDTLVSEFGFAGRNEGKVEVVLAEDTAVELGHPATASQSIVLITFRKELVDHGRISIVGPDIEEMKEGVRYPFAQVVVIAVDPDRIPDPFEMENTQYLMNRLPGYMVRSVPGKLWVRISKAGRDSGLSLEVIGSALIAAYTSDFEGIHGLETLFVTSSKSDVESLGQVKTESDILAGRHKKLVLGIDGDVECSELNCNTCDEKPVCDNLRDIVIERRSLDNARS